MPPWRRHSMSYFLYAVENEIKSNRNIIIFKSGICERQSGLVVSAEPGFTLDILRDVAKSGELMAAAEPQWEVDGKKQGYHMFTYGPLTNELLRRVDPQHRTMGQFFREGNYRTIW